MAETIGDILLKNKAITKEQLNDAVRWNRSHPNDNLNDILVNRGIINEVQLLEAYAEKYDTQFINGDIKVKRADILKLVPQTIAEKNNIMPIDIVGNKLLIVTSKPTDVSAIQDAKVSSMMDIKVCYAQEKTIKTAIDKYYKNAELFFKDTSATKSTSKSKVSITSEETQKKLEDIESSVSNTPVVKLVNSLIQEAYTRGASDIHIEPFEEEVLIRMRIDGDLQEVMRVTKQSLNGIISRIKILSGMDIAEKRIPQDGRYEYDNGDIQCDLRVSTLPTIYGEKCVMRLLNTSGQALLTFDKLGMSKENIDRFNKITSAPNGIILVTGPTGSGKSTTLYAVLNKLNSPKVNLTTIEDPVERQLYGVNQVQVNTKAGLTFASGLRSLLRQDPDVIMVGEIRDYETAEIAIRAAITGHLVLSTLHTNDSIATIDRLIDMGVAPYLVSSSVNAIIAQRLVKRLCPHCKEKVKTTLADKSILEDKEISEMYVSKGCNKCKNTGYSGRIAVYEIVEISNKMKALITKRAGSDELRQEAIKQGAVFLSNSLHDLVKEGITSLEEYKRIVYTV